jgi:hypothetical protein
MNEIGNPFSLDTSSFTNHLADLQGQTPGSDERYFDSHPGYAASLEEAVRSRQMTPQEAKQR